jgi:hypothetical protein
MRIPKFTTINKKDHPRSTPDDQFIDGQNIIFKDDKVKSRWGYTTLGSNLPLDGSILSLGEYTKLRTPDSDLIANTENTNFQYNEDTGVWDEFNPSYNTGTVANTALGSETSLTYGTRFADYIDINTVVRVYYNSGFYYEIGTISNTTIEWESPVSSSLNVSDILVLSETVIIEASYVGATSTSIRWGTISTGVITWNNIVQIASDNHIVKLTKLTDTTFIASFVNDTYHGYLCYGYIESDTLNISTPIQIDTDVIEDIYALATCRISDTSFLIKYYNILPTWRRNAVCNIVDNDIVISSYTAGSYTGSISEMIQYDSTHIIFIGTLYDGSYYRLGVFVITISGNTATDGSITYLDNDVNSGSADKFFSGLIDSDRFAICYKDDDDYIKYMIVNIVDYDIDSAESAVTLSSTTFDGDNIGVVYVNKILSFYQNAARTTNYYRIDNKGSITLTSGTWNTTWPDNVYQIKFNTDTLTGTGDPDRWIIINKINTSTTLEMVEWLEIDSDIDYIIRLTFQSVSDDYFDFCNVIEGLGNEDEKQFIITNGVDPIYLYDGTTLGTLDFTGDGGAAPIVTAKYCAYYYGHLMFAWCNDGTYDLPQSVYWSTRGYPTYWNSALGQGAGYADLIKNDDKITGMEFLKQRLFILKENSIVECYYTGYTDPAFTFTEDKIREKGCPYSRTVINVGERILYKGKDNIHSFDGVSSPQDVGDNIIEYIKVIEDEDYRYKSFAAHISKEFLYVLFVPTSSTAWTPLAFNYKTGSWSIWSFDNEFNTFGVYGDDIVFGDEDGYVYLMDLTELDDNGADITCYAVTKDYSLNEYKQAFILLETILTTETNAGSLQISCSLDFGDNYSTPVVIDQNTAGSIYEHVINWLQHGEQVRFKIENVEGSKFAFESLEIDFKNAGKSVRR